MYRHWIGQTQPNSTEKFNLQLSNKQINLCLNEKSSLKRRKRDSFNKFTSGKTYFFLHIFLSCNYL